MDERFVRLPEGTPVRSVELTVWFTPDGTVPLPQLVDLILAALNAWQVRGVEGDFRLPFAKEYAG